MLRYIREGKHGYAQAIARKYSLDTDPIYKHLWLTEPLTDLNITNYLKKVRDAT